MEKKTEIEFGVVVIRKGNFYLMTKDPDIGYGELDFPNVIFDDDSSAKENEIAIDSMLYDLGVPLSLAAERKFIKKVTCNHSCIKNTYAVEYLELSSLINQKNLTEITWLTEKEMKTSAVSFEAKKLLNAVKNYQRTINKTSLKKVIDPNEILTPSPERIKVKSVRNDSVNDIWFSDISFELIEELAILTAVKQIYNAIPKKYKKHKTFQNVSVGGVTGDVKSVEICDSVQKTQPTVNKSSIASSEKTTACSKSFFESLKNEDRNSNINSTFTNQSHSTTSRKVLDAVENANKSLSNVNTELKRPASTDMLSRINCVKRLLTVSTDVPKENKGTKRPLDESADIVIEFEVSDKKIHEACPIAPPKKMKSSGMKQTSIKSFFTQKQDKTL